MLDFLFLIDIWVSSFPICRELLRNRSSQFLLPSLWCSFFIFFQVENPRTNALRASRSNPDIAGQSVTAIPHGTTNIAQYYQPIKSTCPEHVLKVYRADQSFKYLTVYRETNAQNVVQLALQVYLEDLKIFGQFHSLEVWLRWHL